MALTSSEELDAALRATLATMPAEFDDVLTKLAEISDAVARAGDPAPAFAAFNSDYHTVSTLLQKMCQEGGFKDEQFITTLGLNFATLYFTALREWLSPDRGIPSCWQLLLSQEPGVLSFVDAEMLGFNAHINRDLCHALVTTFQDRQFAPNPPDPRLMELYDDYQLVNEVFVQALPQLRTATHTAMVQPILARLAGRSELDAIVGRDEDPVDADFIALAREVAWAEAVRLQGLSGGALCRAATRIEHVASAIAHVLLIKPMAEILEEFVEAPEPKDA